jgi:flavin-binding protein dodecin
MEPHTYKIIEIVGSSPESIEDAIQRGITRASQGLRNIGWFQVTDTRGHVVGGKIAHFQVTLKVGFTLDEGLDASGESEALEYRQR